MEDTASIIGRIYAAAAGEADWTEAILPLHRALGAATSSLFAASGPEGAMESLHGAGFDPADLHAYAGHYHRLDPWLQRLGPALGSTAPHVILGESVLAPDAYRRTEFYNDFGRRAGLEWVAGAVGRLGPAGRFNLGFQRPPGQEAFSPQDIALLAAATPHLQRGLQLRERLRAAAAAPSLRVLDALPEAALVLDAELGVRHANATATRLCGPASGIFLARDGSRPGASQVLRLAGAAEGARLASLVRGVALLGMAGGAFRLTAGRQPPIALLVSPLPAALRSCAGGDTPGTAPGLALVLLRPLERTPPPAQLLQDLFGLTVAEAKVASGLAGGTRAEDLAARRGVSLATIRAQVRAVLEKTGTLNLRELEALLASLPLPPPAGE
ncbi:MAG TPA: hypothetical protein VIL69_11195 [Roseomonas sp.]|jgi:DNA-binding CsgD family transcriptional regulator